jgi:hypothetical protein
MCINAKADTIDKLSLGRTFEERRCVATGRTKIGRALSARRLSITSPVALNVKFEVISPLAPAN